MGRVFINYRVLDERFGVAAVYEILVQRFGVDSVFRDCVSLQPGEHYPSAILEAVSHSDVLLAVIGPGWLTLADEFGFRLIDRHDDWVRREIATAFEYGIPVIPVLLEGALQSTVVELPHDISRLALIQPALVSHVRLGEDVQRLAARIATLAPQLADHVPGPPVVPSTGHQTAWPV
jgi:hypothetical protein